VLLITIVAFSFCFYEKTAISQVTATSGGEVSGSFTIPRHEAIVATAWLRLTAIFAIQRMKSPGLIYVKSSRWFSGTKIAYVCIIHHSYAKEEEEDEDFPFTLSLTNENGHFETTITTDGSKVFMNYSLSTIKDKRTKDGELLTISGENISLANGRILELDMTSMPPTLTQFDRELPREIFSKTDKEVIADISKIITAIPKGDSRVRAIKLERLDIQSKNELPN